MEITTELIEHLMDLSRLYFSEEEKENFKDELNQTLKQINDIENVDTTNVTLQQKCMYVQDLREDEVKESLSNNLALKNAPKQSRGAIVVPTVVEVE